MNVTTWIGAGGYGDWTLGTEGYGEVYTTTIRKYMKSAGGGDFLHPQEAFDWVTTNYGQLDRDLEVWCTGDFGTTASVWTLQLTGVDLMNDHTITFVTDPASAHTPAIIHGRWVYRSGLLVTTSAIRLYSLKLDYNSNPFMATTDNGLTASSKYCVDSCLLLAEATNYLGHSNAVTVAKYRCCDLVFKSTIDFATYGNAMQAVSTATFVGCWVIFSGTTNVNLSAVAVASALYCYVDGVDSGAPISIPAGYIYTPPNRVTPDPTVSALTADMQLTPDSPISTVVSDFPSFDILGDPRPVYSVYAHPGAYETNVAPPLDDTAYYNYSRFIREVKLGNAVQLVLLANEPPQEFVVDDIYINLAPSRPRFDLGSLLYPNQVLESESILNAVFNRQVLACAGVFRLDSDT